jgi:hypothetical protein
MEVKLGPLEKEDKKQTDINPVEIFQKNRWVHPFWQQKEW